MQHEVFISHAADNKLVADAMLEKLEKEGIRCWIAPRDIRPGDSWGGAIVRAIETSKILILIFSSKSNRSHQVLREVERAVQKDVVLLPFRIEDITPSEDMEYFLSTTQWLDALSANLDEHLETLSDTIKLILENQHDALNVSEVIALQNEELTSQDATEQKEGEELSAQESSSHEITEESAYVGSSNQGDETDEYSQEKSVTLDDDTVAEIDTEIVSSDEPESALASTASVQLDKEVDVEVESEGEKVEADVVDARAADLEFDFNGEPRLNDKEEPRFEGGPASARPQSGEKQPLARDIVLDRGGEKEPVSEPDNADRPELDAETSVPKANDDLVIDRNENRRVASVESTSGGRGPWILGLVFLLAGGGYAYQMLDHSSITDLFGGQNDTVDTISERSNHLTKAADKALKDQRSVALKASEQVVVKANSDAIAQEESQTEDPEMPGEQAIEQQRQAEAARQEAQRQLALRQKRVADLKLEASQGSANAAFALAEIYAAGDGVEKDSQESMNWLKQAAEQGLAKAQYRLGLAFSNGSGVSRNKQSAIDWMTQAADQGMPEALNELGLWYEKGDGVEQDYAKAFEFYNRAAEQGDPSGQRSLGIFYEFGLGVKQDYQQALKWYRSAAAQGDSKADLFRQDLESKLAE